MQRLPQQEAHRQHPELQSNRAVLVQARYLETRSKREETGERGDFPFGLGGLAGQVMAGLPFLLGKAPWTTVFVNHA